MNENNNRPAMAAAAARFVLAAVLALAIAAPVAAQEDTRPEICMPDDPAVCLIRCRIHKRECFVGCRARKRQCIRGVRADVHACKLECRLDDASTPEEASACKRECVAGGIERAHDECKVGHPTCVRLCHPESCGERCGIDREGSPVDPAPDGEAATTDEAPETCEPPVDRECLGRCGTELRSCAARVHEAADQCLAECRELRGWDRYRCVRDCADAAIEHGSACRGQLRECVSECGIDVPQREPGTDGVE
jgi:hypothetical protein